MEHEVFVPVPVASLRRTLGDPARVARCLPGFQQDADATAGPLAGRLKVRAGGHTITYRGALTLRPAEEGETFSVAGQGVEARGTGSAKLALIVRLTRTDGGTTIGFAGTASGEGRILDLGQAAALTAAHRLLDRFTQQLVTESLAEPDTVGTTDPEGFAGARGAAATDDRSTQGVQASGGAPSDGERPEGEPSEEGHPAAETPGTEASDASAADESVSEAASSDEASTGPASSGPVPDGSPPADSPPDDSSPDDPAHSAEGAPDAEAGSGSVFDTPVPPSSLDGASPELEFGEPDEPPAEAAHARRTMIGRSTEEVDHAPPRGRYAPVPAPETGVVGITLRWIAPAAALAIASAVVVGRALRRRR
ncbi:SRPBCC domain-containing protein [Streptomyces sp. NBC_01754]|uniref:SRPBCC domain-containing protein n=1 Tax=Streptomyces sp. NBC_01754 TaxID=2975930 RepID=UPI002DDC70B8|nr:SRPBCC domain-containing protein [Streptomyces sp. NBC_01754]WSC93327.1 SRPBCC domain-containing protein [Streptomyces sp. NBC_01754]